MEEIRMQEKRTEPFSIRQVVKRLLQMPERVFQSKKGASMHARHKRLCAID